jgi:hypothetical protein
MWLLDDRPELRTNQSAAVRQRQIFFWPIRRFPTLMDQKAVAVPKLNVLATEIAGELKGKR